MPLQPRPLARWPSEPIAWCSSAAGAPWLPAWGRSHSRSQGLQVYLKTLAAEKAPPTRAQSFLEAVKFTRGALGLHADLGERLSSRVNGAAFQAYSGKRVLRQRPPLRVRSVCILESMVFNATDDRDAVLAGGFCFM